MAAFSSLQPFMLDSDSLVFPPNSPSTTDGPNNPFSILDQIETPYQHLDQITTKGLGFGRSSSSWNHHSPAMDPSPLHKRKASTQSKERKGKKQKKMEKSEKKISGDVPTGYIHVRARRGQATDSHSLAERVRREKISERMKLLQSLVPGCDKVTGKALMLDEIINYVQSLQYQTEFLSMKLASLSPACYDFGTGLESFVARPDPDLIINVPSVEGCTPAIAGDSDDSLLWQQSQMPDVFFPSI